MITDKLRFFWFELRSFALNAVISMFWLFLCVGAFFCLFISIFELFQHSFIKVVMTLILTHFKDLNKFPLSMWGWFVLFMVSFVVLRESKNRFARINEHSRYQAFHQ
jgi:hypothetical protein